jgi:hypothetical protein
MGFTVVDGYGEDTRPLTGGWSSSLIFHGGMILAGGRVDRTGHDISC